MASAKPTQAPAFDASTTWKVLDDELKKDDGSGYAVFQDKSFPRWKRWVDGTAEFDGSGLRDTVDANAQYLDEVKNDLDKHRDADNARHTVLRQDLTTLRAEVEALQSGPFPG